MFAGIRKRIKTSNLYFVTGLLVLLMLFLSIGQDLFHNHKPDLEQHDDCPAFHIYLLFSASIVFDCIYWFILLLLVVLNLTCYRPVFYYFQKTHNPRAPPFQIF